jgi:hypothetical protein
MATKTLTPGTMAHEAAVKKALRTKVKSAVDMLDALQVVDAKKIDIGNSFVAFRFQTVVPAAKTAKKKGG